LLGFVALVCVRVKGVCVRDCRGLGVCAVGRVGQSAGSEYVGGKGSVVTGWGRMGAEGGDRGKSG
jgi:hypothetical protein